MRPSSDSLTICAVGDARSCHVRNRVRCFAARGHRVYLLTEAVVGIPSVTEIKPEAAVPVPLLRGLTRTLNCRRAIQRCHPDLIHVHFARRLAAWITATIPRTPLVVSLMGGDILFEEQDPPTPRGRRLTIELLRRAQLITAKSNFLIDALAPLGDFRDKTVRISWGVDPEQFRRRDATALRQRLGLQNADRVIFSPKILRPFYNIDLLIEALPAILRAHPQALLLLSEYDADDAYREQLRARARVLGVEGRVVFAGNIPHPAMPDYYSLAEVAVSIPSSDGLPQALLEALACATPVVLSRLERYSEVVADGESACLVDLQPASIAAGVNRLLSDDRLRETLARTGRELVCARYNFPEEVARLESYFRKLLAQPPRRAGWWRAFRMLVSVLLYQAWDDGAIRRRLRQAGRWLAHPGRG